MILCVQPWYLCRTLSICGEGRRPRDRRKKRPAAEAADVQVRYECAIGSEDEDGVQWYLSETCLYAPYGRVCSGPLQQEFLITD